MTASSRAWQAVVMTCERGSAVGICSSNSSMSLLDRLSIFAKQTNPRIKSTPKNKQFAVQRGYEIECHGKGLAVE